MTEPLLLLATQSRWRWKLEAESFQLITWPVLRIQRPDTFAALDEAIGNLYGYDWIIFVNPDSAQCFLERLAFHGQDVSDLDSVRVCSVGDATTATLERAQIHVDVFAKQFTAASIVEELKNFAGHDAMDRSNFLIPQAAIGRDYLKHHIDETGARVDVVTAYQTVSAEDLTRLSALQSMLHTRSVDAVLFGSSEETREFSRLFDTNDLGRLVGTTPVLTIDDQTSTAVISLGVAQPIHVSEPIGVSIGEVLSNPNHDLK